MRFLRGLVWAAAVAVVMGCAGGAADMESAAAVDGAPAGAPAGTASEPASGAPTGTVPQGSSTGSGASDKAAAMKQAPAPASEPMAAESAPMEKTESFEAEVAEDVASAPVPPASEDPVRTRQADVAQRTRYLSADDSNSQASPVIVRQLINAGMYVQPGVVRTYEFLNYHDFTYPAPTDGPVSIIPEMQDIGDGEYTLQVALRSRDVAPEDIPPLSLTFVVDVSGSMAGEPLNLARELLVRFARRLRGGDRVSIVACNRDAKVLLRSHTVSAETESVIRDHVLPALTATDVTDLATGIALAYEVAGEEYDHRYLNRVIVVSDGAANAGELALETISRSAEDSERQGIYLAGIGVGQGINDSLMNAFTDAGRGAYLFVDGIDEIDRILTDPRFGANFDLALKDVRLKMVMPEGWNIVEFHGEQISAVASEVVPQYLAPSDQMIYHLVLSGDGDPDAAFVFEAEYTPIGGDPARIGVTATVGDMLERAAEIITGDAIVAFAEALKEMAWPLEDNRDANVAALDEAREALADGAARTGDAELESLARLAEAYRKILRYGEDFRNVRDRESDDIPAVLGLSPNVVLGIETEGERPDVAVRPLRRLLQSTALVPQEGYQFLAISSGPVGNPSPAGSGELSGTAYPDPMPDFMGSTRVRSDGRQVYDLHRVMLRMRAPADAASFSFDFNFFSAEYPDYVQQSYNDTFYAALQADSTNRGRSTNISFDSEGGPIEVDNNYFQNPFHPVPNTGTGFDAHGSTGWLRTSWPISGGEELTITFSVHDEGDAIFDSLVVIDNLRFHDYPAVGTTDPLN